MANETTNSTIPNSEYTSAFSRKPGWKSAIKSLASKVAGMVAVVRAIGAWVVTDGLGNVLNLVDHHGSPAAVLRPAGEAEQRQSIDEIEGMSQHLLVSGRVVALAPPAGFEAILTER